MKMKLTRSTASVLLYWLIFIALLGLFFTNDFGLVDIHKTSLITAIGIDVEEDEVQVTAEVAVPQPSQSGEAIKYTLVQGSGLTIADALNEINAKTGFYPKLQFCRLIIVGESCREHELFRVLGCFYRKNYSALTALIAACDGSAKDMLSQQSEVTERTSEAITKVLSDEIKKSANASSVNLKDIAELNYSKSEACFMPLIEVSKPGSSANGGNGDNVGGEGGNSQNGSGGQQGSGGQSGGGEGGQSGGEGGQSQGQSGGQSSQSGGGQQEPVEFSARKTAVFSRGKFKGVLDDQQSFALAVLKNDIRLAVLPCDSEDGTHYTVGLKIVKGDVKFKVNEGVPELMISFSANAQIQGAKVVVDPKKTVEDDEVPQKVLDGASKELEERFKSLVAACREYDCDLLGLKETMYKFENKYYDAFKNDILERVQTQYKIDIISVN